MRSMHVFCLIFALLSTSQVQGSCLGGPSILQTADANALTMFVTLAVFQGDFPSIIKIGNPTFSGSGLLAGDAICTDAAAFPTSPIQRENPVSGLPYYNQDINNNAVQFKMIASDSTNDVIDRLKSIDGINIVDSDTRNCIAASLTDLFTGDTSNPLLPNPGYGYSGFDILDEGGNTVGNMPVWTGTGLHSLLDTTQWSADKVGGRGHAKNAPGAIVSSTYQCSDWAQTTSSGISGFFGEF